MDLDFGTSFVCSSSCGDVLKLSISFDEDGIVEAISVKAFGCDAVKQISSLEDYLVGLPIDELIMIDPMDISEEMHVGILIVNGIRAAITNYAKKKYMAEHEEERNAGNRRYE